MILTELVLISSLPFSNGMYEEVLQMQQRLHAAASSEIEKTLSIQLKHIATVSKILFSFFLSHFPPKKEMDQHLTDTC